MSNSWLAGQTRERERGQKHACVPAGFSEFDMLALRGAGAAEGSCSETGLPRAGPGPRLLLPEELEPIPFIINLPV